MKRKIHDASADAMREAALALKKAISRIEELEAKLKDANEYAEARRIEACEAADALGEKNLEIAELRMRLKKYEEPVAKFKIQYFVHYSDDETGDVHSFETSGGELEVNDRTKWMVEKDDEYFYVIIIEEDI